MELTKFKCPACGKTKLKFTDLSEWNRERGIYSCPECCLIMDCKRLSAEEYKEFEQEMKSEIERKEKKKEE